MKFVLVLTHNRSMAKSRSAIALDESTLSLHLKAGLTARSL
ncbi:hypothetical protein [Coleofasciculus sp. FACHB-1120]|nr:hypothetical protein [Coleofasciculus sp. FACHB-1120]